MLVVCFRSKFLLECQAWSSPGEGLQSGRKDTNEKFQGPQPQCSAELIDSCIYLPKKERKTTGKNTHTKREKAQEKNKTKKTQAPRRRVFEPRAPCGAVPQWTDWLTNRLLFVARWWWPVFVAIFIAPILKYSLVPGWYTSRAWTCPRAAPQPLIG